MRHTILLLGLLALTCGNDETSAGALAGATPCEKWNSLAAKVGCMPPRSCSVAVACSEVAVHWLECVARDLAQCICESDDDLNCEGSFKPNEGPAKCVAEYRQFDACDACGGPCDGGVEQ